MSLEDNQVIQKDHRTQDEQEEIECESENIIQLANIGPGDNNDVTDSVEEPQTVRCALRLHSIRQIVFDALVMHWATIKRCLIILSVCLYLAYFGYCMYFRFGDDGSIRLVVFTILEFLVLLRQQSEKKTRKQRGRLWESRFKPYFTSETALRFRAILPILLKIVVFCIIAIYIIANVVVDHPQNLIAVVGQAVFIILFFIFSENPAKVNWHTVFWGFALQYILALIILHEKWGFLIFKFFGDRVTEFLRHSSPGSVFMFSDSLLSSHIFAFKVLPNIIFVYIVMTILYYVGVMPFIVRVVGRLLASTMGTTPAESLNAVANIFIGITEAPLIIAPFLKDMTCSELHAVMTGGFATVAGGVLGAFISFGIPANHLLSASVMSAPAALAISKLAYPEVEVSKSTRKDFDKIQKSMKRNFAETLTTGATASAKLLAVIAVNIIAFLSLLNFVNETLVWFGERAGVEGFTLEFIYSYLFFPIAFFIGTDGPDCFKIAELIGIKTFTNEFIAYLKLATIIDNGNILANYTSFYNDTAYWYWNEGNVILNVTQQELVGGVISKKSAVVATYALCGFSNVAAIGVVLGGMSALAPTRKRDFGRMVVRAMMSGTMACFITACIAGLLFKDY